MGTSRVHQKRLTSPGLSKAAPSGPTSGNMMLQYKNPLHPDLVRNYAAQSVSEKFRVVLKQKLADCLRTYGRHWVTPEEFETFYNCENAKKGYKSLDTKHMSLNQFFTMIEDVFAVETDKDGTVKKIFEATMGTSSVHQKRPKSPGPSRAVPSGPTSEDGGKLLMMSQLKERRPPDLVRKYANQAVPEKFRLVLKQRLKDCLSTYGRRWVTPEEFVKFFNSENADKGHQTLNTKQLSLHEFLAGVEDVFAVETDENGTVKRIFEASMSTTRVHEKSPTLSGLSTALPSAFELYNTEELNSLIVDLHKMNMWFQGRTISIDEYLTELEMCFPLAGDSFLRRERTKVKLAEFIIKHSDEDCPVWKTGDDLTVGSALPTKHTHLHTFPYSEALQVEDPPSCVDINALVNEVDVGSPYLRMYVTFSSRLAARHNLQGDLQKFYEHFTSLGILPERVFPGMVCVVPFDGKSDFRRAVVLCRYYNFHVKVAYVDFGIVHYVPIEWLRYLQPRFFRQTVFAEPVSLSEMLDWPKRRLSRVNLLNKTVFLRLRSLDRIDDSFVAEKTLPDWALRELPRSTSSPSSRLSSSQDSLCDTSG